MSLSILILAAGQGRRMNSDLPKVLQPLAGQPLLQHVIDTARALEPAEISVVYGHGGERVPQALAGEDVGWVLQAEQLGTGHAVMQAMPRVPDDRLVLVLYGDVPLVRRETLAELVQLAGGTGSGSRRGAAAAKSMGLLTVVLEDPTGYGRIVRDGRGRIRRIVEHKDATKKELAIRECNTGIMVVPARLLRRWLAGLRNDNAQREYYLTDIIALAVKEKVTVTPVVAAQAAEVLGVNDRVQLAEVEGAYRLRRARELMLAGATVADPARLDVRGEVSVGRDVFLDVNVVLEGRVTLGDGTRIGPNCVIRNSSIGPGTTVFPNCVIDSATIGAECHIGPFARFRPSSTLERGVHVGNFVEVKNSRMDEGSKANHLTYLGDAVIGRAVNVGAGTVTCNYDGANKWQTVVEDRAFIGSGAMLVAPVRIGAGATIGAGSTITKDAPAEQLTLERSKQLSIEGWKRPVKQVK